MAPIFDSDIAEKRWQEAEWRRYELWEKVEQRLRRRKVWWVIGTLVLFFVLMAVPVVMDRFPKWKSQSAARRLSTEISRLRVMAGEQRAAFRISFEPGPGLRYRIERGSSCSTEEWTAVRSGALLESGAERFSVLAPEDALKAGIPGIARDFCYDELAGNHAVLRGDGINGFVIAAVNDLTVSRLDRASIVLFKGQSAEISFE